jgi:hypothetical protein
MVRRPAVSKNRVRSFEGPVGVSESLVEPGFFFVRHRARRGGVDAAHGLRDRTRGETRTDAGKEKNASENTPGNHKYFLP